MTFTPLRTAQQRFVFAGVLVALLAITRDHHYPTVSNVLPSASWAVFFLAGMYLRSVSIFGLLLAVTAFVDYVAIAWGGVSDFCVSPTYAALLPAYGALWLAGRIYASRCGLRTVALLPLATAVVVGAAVCELVSGGSFYLFSGRFADPALGEVARRFLRYFSASLASLAFWVTGAAAVHVVAMTIKGDAAISLLKR